MRRFNLEEAKAGKPVCTKDGRQVEILCFDTGIKDYPVEGKIRASGGHYNVYTWTKDGRFFANVLSSADLMMGEGETSICKNLKQVIFISLNLLAVFMLFFFIRRTETIGEGLACVFIQMMIGLQTYLIIKRENDEEN